MENETCWYVRSWIIELRMETRIKYFHHKLFQMEKKKLCQELEGQKGNWKAGKSEVAPY